jgi:predicted nucleic acid-binding protein
MSERWVVNASPLILLAKVHQLDLLPQLTEAFVVPEAVIAEVLAGPADDLARQFLETKPVTTVAVSAHPLVLAWDLGAGETAVLSHALANPDWKAIIDDGAARRCAHTLNIPLAGTLAIILAARQKQMIPAAAPVLRALLAHGFRVDEPTLRQALWQTVGESWQ